MKTHNANIYHCVACGRVVHSERGAEPPQCCGHKMAKFDETIREDEDNVGPTDASGPSHTTPPEIDARTKPSLRQADQKAC